MAIPTFATELEDEAVKKEVMENGTIVESEIVENEKGVFQKDIYVYTKNLTETRSAEQEYEKTVMCTYTPITRDTEGSQKHNAVYLTIHYVTRSTADDYDNETGYRLTRVTTNRTNNNVGFNYLTATCSSLRASAPQQTKNLSSVTDNSAVLYCSFSKYISDVQYAVLGATLDYTWYGSSEQLGCYLFNNM